ncbi:MAG: winged helix DNA-binding domain-containing protein [Propionibacteriaceae bacterium]|nr:AlkZ family DNA glycosylase [Micropruina sp.]
MSELSLLRIVAQGLAGPRASAPEGVVARLSCVQAQELPGALESVAQRTTSAQVADVREALSRGTIVRSWTQRGTLHLAAAADLAWILALTAERTFSNATQRYRQLGIDETVIARACTAIESMLAEKTALTRAEIMARWGLEGLTDVPQRGIHLIAILCRRLVLVQGPPHPTNAREQLFVAADAWLPAQASLDRDEALARWVRAFFLGHGPAPVNEFARWTGLPLGDARRGLDAVRAELAAVDIGGVTHWMAPDLPDRLAASRGEARGVLLLPGFDELLLGYLDRSATIGPEHAERFCPGGNGVFRPTIVHDGRVVGLWRWDRTKRHIEPEIFDGEVTPAVREAIVRREAMAAP